MIPIETALARLGSRFCLNLRPQSRQIGHGALGRYLDVPADLAIGVEAGGQRRVVPLTRTGEVFESVHMELTLTSVTFRCESRALNVGLDVVFCAPFYPRDAEVSTAPVFYVDLHARILPTAFHQPRRTDPRVMVFLGLNRPDTQITAGADSLDLAYVTRIDKQEMRFEPVDPRPPTRRDWMITEVRCRERIAACSGPARAEHGEIRWALDLSDGPKTAAAVWVAHVGDPVFERKGKPYRFLAAARHDSLESLAAWAREQRETLIEMSRFFDSVVADSSLSKSQHDLIAFTFQSYLMNTWWVVNNDGDDWFSVWEGVCRYHSTVDVEYNLSMVYFAFWPELLERTFAEWAEHEKPAPPDARGRPTGFLSHDVGSCQNGDGQDYPHDMEVEENTNFILLLHALWRWTGRDEMVRRHEELLSRLTRYVIAADTTGNGFPDQGVANTIDDAAASVQFAREQTYLGVKSICAARAAADLARRLGDEQLPRECDEFAARATATLERDAWLGDHYAVCLDKDAGGVRDVWSGQEMGGGLVEGWDAYSIYTANGLLLPLMAGLETGLNFDRLRQDVSEALDRARCEYGCTHSSYDHGNLWISQNLWRDFVAAYLGLDLLNEFERYWAFEVQQNRGEPGHCFVDTYGWNCLEYYPRGVTAVGLMMASLGLVVDRPAKRVRLQPVRVPWKMPLLPFVDWQRRLVPRVEYHLENGRVRCRLDHCGLLDGWAVEMEPE